MNPISRKEVRDAVSNRWVIGYAAILGVLGFAAAWFGLRTAGGLATQLFGRTTATITNLSLMLAPLVGLILGASSIAVERDGGTLRRLLSQPITPGELLWSKYVGLVAALSAATLLGFAPAALIIANAAGIIAVARFLLFPLLTIFLVAAMTAVGFVMTAGARSVSRAVGSAVMAWFGFVVLYDLLLIGSLLVASMSPGMLIAMVAANPVDAMRLLVVLALEPDLHVLGPAGIALVTSFGRAGALTLLVAVPAVWTGAALFIARRRFYRSVYEPVTRRPLINNTSTNYSFVEAPESGVRY